MKDWHNIDLDNAIVYIDGKPFGGLKSLSLDRARGRDHTFATLYRNAAVVTSFEIRMVDIEISPDLIDMLLGRPPRTVGGYTLRQCMAVAESIAMGAWAVRCAESYLRKDNA